MLCVVTDFKQCNVSNIDFWVPYSIYTPIFVLGFTVCVSTTDLSVYSSTLHVQAFNVTQVSFVNELYVINNFYQCNFSIHCFDPNFWQPAWLYCTIVYHIVNVL